MYGYIFCYIVLKVFILKIKNKHKRYNFLKKKTNISFKGNHFNIRFIINWYKIKFHMSKLYKNDIIYLNIYYQNL